MYSITKEIPFCYGHRLLGHTGKCRHLHGHNAVAVVRLEAEGLDGLGMVCDFADIGGFLKTWINIELDHTLLLQAEDPVLPLLQQAGERVYVMADNPSAENIARLIFEQVECGGYPVVEVIIQETDTASASYRRSTP